jgi:hypothetical protein
VALVVALAIWAIYLVGALAGTEPYAPPNEDLWFWILVIGPCLVDLVVLVRVLRRSVGLGSLTWLAVRALLSGAGFLLLTLPAYAVAFLLLIRPAKASPDGDDPTRPHAYRPASGGWYKTMTPLRWSGNLLGAAQLTARMCAVCGEPASAEIHAVDDTEG